MHIKDLIVEKEGNRLSKGAIMLWITFTIAIAFWVTAIIRSTTVEMPGGLFNLLIALLTYNLARRGTDSATDLIAVLKRPAKGETK